MYRLLALLAAVVLPLFPAGAVLAASAVPQDGQSLLDLLIQDWFNPELIVEMIINDIAGNPPVRDWFVRIGVILATVFFVYNLYVAMVTGQVSMVTDSIWRAAVVGAVFGNLPAVAEVITSFHGAMAAIGDVVYESLGRIEKLGPVFEKFERAASELQKAASEFSWWELGAFLNFLVLAIIPAILMVLLMVIAGAIYQFLALGSYLMLAFVVLITPISISFLTTRSMQRFTYEWLQVILHSALVILFAKAAIGIVMYVTFLGPLEQYADNIIKAAEGKISPPEGVPRHKFVLQVATDLRVYVQIILGVLVGIFTLMNVQGIASSFVGRVESVAGAIAGMYASARMLHGGLRRIKEALGG